MTETLQWSFIGRDSAEFKLLKPYLRRGGTGRVDSLQGKLAFLLLV